MTLPFTYIVAILAPNQNITHHSHGAVQAKEGHEPDTDVDPGQPILQPCQRDEAQSVDESTTTTIQGYLEV